MDAVAVEVSSRAVVVLGGAWVGVAGEDLGVTKRYSGIEGVRDRGVPQRMGTDVARDAGNLRDPQNHPVDVASVDRPPGNRSQDERSSGPVVRCPRHASRARMTGTVSGMVAGLVPLPTRCRTRWPRRVSW